MTPGAYLRLCREAVGKSVATVAAELASEPRWPEHVRAAHLELIERDEQPACLATLSALGSLYPIDFNVLVVLANQQPLPRKLTAPARAVAGVCETTTREAAA